MEEKEIINSTEDTKQQSSLSPRPKEVDGRKDPKVALVTFGIPALGTLLCIIIYFLLAGGCTPTEPQQDALIWNPIVVPWVDGIPNPPPDSGNPPIPDSRSSQVDTMKEKTEEDTKEEPYPLQGQQRQNEEPYHVTDN